MASLRRFSVSSARPRLYCRKRHVGHQPQALLQIGNAVARAPSAGETGADLGKRRRMRRRHLQFRHEGLARVVETIEPAQRHALAVIKGWLVRRQPHRVVERTQRLAPAILPRMRDTLLMQILRAFHVGCGKLAASIGKGLLHRPRQNCMAAMLHRVSRGARPNCLPCGRLRLRRHPATVTSFDRIRLAGIVRSSSIVLPGNF